MSKRRKLFCEYGPLAYKIPLFFRSKEEGFKWYKKSQKICKKRNKENFEYILKGDTKIFFRKLHEIYMQLQKNKVKNLELSSKNGMY